jgi:hypothetical protein
MKTQFELRIIDSLKAGVAIAAVFASIKVICIDGARALAGYGMGLAVGWGILLAVGVLFAYFRLAESVSSDPMRLTVTPQGLNVLNLKNKQELRIDFKQLVSYRFLEQFIMEELSMKLEGGRTISLTTYNFSTGGKDFRSMVQAFEAAANRYNQQNEESHVIRREAPFIQGKSM